ncbi:hypothetical protein LWI28_028856 [Acer negundo]|uniref:RNase H type-1 domain-containing protein n=1 Tax=Acer negundo TaxID=4023 RepID=A0AAD5NPA3_ACENE|nr:hypothetical protein LWI28_028856 [Acer negundo]
MGLETDLTLLMLDLKERCVDNKVAKSVRRSGWKLPSDMDLCFFVDGSTRGNLGEASIRGVFRDSWGKILCLFSFYIGVDDSISVEVFAIHRACQLVALNQTILYRKITIFNDSNSAVSRINGEDFGNFKLIGLIQDIRQFQVSMVNIAFKHTPREANSLEQSCKKWF